MSKNVWLKRRRKKEIKKIVQDAIDKHKAKGENNLSATFIDEVGDLEYLKMKHQGNWSHRLKLMEDAIAIYHLERNKNGH